MMDQILAETSKKMDHTIETVRHELTGLRTGRASLHLVDGITVPAYGSDMPLNQVATLAMPCNIAICCQPPREATNASSSSIAGLALSVELRSPRRLR